MCAAFPPKIKFPCMSRIKEDHGLDAHQTVFGIAQNHTIHAGFPGYLGRAGPKCGSGMANRAPSIWTSRSNARAASVSVAILAPV